MMHAEPEICYASSGDVLQMDGDIDGQLHNKILCVQAQQEAKRLAQSQTSPQGRPGAGYGQSYGRI